MGNNNSNFLGNEQMVPRNENLERTILGEILMAGANGFIEIENIISTKSFYSDIHATIYLACAMLVEAKRDVNTQELFQELYREGKLDYVGGASYIASLARNVVSSHALEQHAKELRVYELKRGAFLLAEKMKEMASDQTTDETEVLEFADRGLTELQTNTECQVFSMDESLSRYYEWVLENEEHKGSALSSGLAGLDYYIHGGFRAPDLIVLGARPSMGKTQFSVNFAKSFVMQGKHTLLFSLEMKDVQIIGRLVERYGVKTSHVIQGTMSIDEKTQQERNMSELQGLRLHIASSESHKQLSAIKAESYRLKRRGELDVIIIDYLGYIKTKGNFKNQRYLEVGYITSELKALAKELNVPIILLAQVGRDNSGSAVELPSMSDLRESGNIEQDADIIIFPHRPYYYDTDAKDQLGRSWKDRGMLYIAKNRNGKRNVVTYFMNDEDFKEIWDDEQANEQLPHE